MSQTRLIGRHATSVYNDGEYQCVKYHSTDVVKFNNKRVIINSGGWMTNTTKTRMNQASNQFGLGFQVYQKDFSWFVTLPNGETIPFENGMEFSR